MTKDGEDDKAETKSSLPNGDAEAQIPKPIAAVTQKEDEVDEFGLKITNVKKRLYDLDGVESAGKKDEDGDDDGDGDGFRTPLNELEEKRTAAESTVKQNESPDESKSFGQTEPLGKLDTSVAKGKESEPATPADQNGVSEKKSPGSKSSASSPNAKRMSSVVATPISAESSRAGVSEWSHMQLAPRQEEEKIEEDEGDWQDMPAFATHTIYDDWGKVLAREEAELEMQDDNGYNQLGGAGKGYTKVQLDEDARSATSMDDDTAYLFKQSKTTTLLEEDEEGRDMLSQMQATKDLLTESQRIAYVGVVRIATMDIYKEAERLERTRGSKKFVENYLEALQLWGQKMMVRLYSHMEIDSSEQVMIEQLAEHGVQAADLTPPLMQNAQVKNPANEQERKQSTSTEAFPTPSSESLEVRSNPSQPATPATPGNLPAPYNEEMAPDDMEIKSPSAIADQKKIDIDLRWTVLCDLFLVMVSDSTYDARSRTLLEHVGKALAVDWLDICRFEKRITDALEMQEAADKENWNEEDHMEKREKAARNRKLMMMGLATVGGGLVIGLSAGLLAPVIGAGFAAGFTTIGVAGTSTFFGGAGAAALITSTGIITGSTIGIRASSRRMGAVKTFEYRPLHNNKRVNLIVTIAGWMTGKVDDVRLPFSTVDPIMGDMYSVLWEPEMLQSMGQTINILATEALTQGLQQILGSTILIALMAALQLPIVLTKLAYLIDNPWNVSLARADQAGLILADSLMDRNLGSRPITLCGFSIGSRVIFACLKELAKKNQYGLIQNVYLYGSPMVVNKDDYIRARTVVSGRFLNGYATNDWILGYLFRATSGGIMRVAGLAPVEIAGIENIDCTEHVPGHMSYRQAMPKLMQEAGWAVESLEFTEIEDPDPENHEKRQRELLNEIEEARKQLEEKPNKRGLKALFSRSKKLAEKKEWETYDERAKTAPAEGQDDGGPVLFDVDAIAREVAELAAEGIEIKEIQSTLPPMKLNVNNDAIASGRTSLSDTGSGSTAREHPRRSHTFSAGSLSKKSSASSLRKKTSTEGFGNGYLGPSSPPPPSKKSPWWRRSSKDEGRSGSSESLGTDERISKDFQRPHARSLSRGSYQSAEVERSPRPPLHSAQTAPAVAGVGAAAGVGAGVAAIDLDHNAWADEDEFGNKRNGEMEMTFE